MHEGGFGLTATDDGLFVFTRPDGSPIADCGPLPTETDPNDSAVIVGAGAPPADDVTLEAPALDEAGALRRSTRRFAITADA